MAVKQLPQSPSLAELTTAAGQGRHGYPDNLEPPYAHNEVESRVMRITLNFLLRMW